MLLFRFPCEIYKWLSSPSSRSVWRLGHGASCAVIMRKCSRGSFLVTTVHFIYAKGDSGLNRESDPLSLNSVKPINCSHDPATTANLRWSDSYWFTESFFKINPWIAGCRNIINYEEQISLSYNDLGVTQSLHGNVYKVMNYEGQGSVHMLAEFKLSLHVTWLCPHGLGIWIINRLALFNALMLQLTLTFPVKKVIGHIGKLTRWQPAEAARAGSVLF